METRRKLYHKIGEVCRMMDIPSHVLRYWESEFTSLRPRKNSAGQRVYSERDIQTLQVIRRLLHDEGFTIAGARKRLQEIQHQKAGAVKAVPEPPAEQPSPSVETQPGPPPPPTTPGFSSERLVALQGRLAALIERLRAWEL